MPTKKSRLPGPGQIAEMGRLTQQSAAWLTKTSPRQLRDDYTVPREADGSYNAQNLVGWVAENTPRLEITDAELEQVLRCLETRESDWAVSRIVEILQTLREKHGNRFCITFFDAYLAELLQYKRSLDACGPMKILETLPADEDLLADAKKRVKHDIAEAKLERLTFCMECEPCRVRQGRTWIVRQLSDDERAFHIGGLCPDCMATLPSPAANATSAP